MKEATRDALGIVLMIVGILAYYTPLLLIIVVGVFFPVIMLVMVPVILLWSTYLWIVKGRR